MHKDRNLLVFSGNANRPLADAVCKELGVRMGKALVGKFSDGEVQVEIEENVRGQEVFVIQPTCAPTAENFMELLVLIDALKRASVATVTAVVPYFGYARQDRRPRSARTWAAARTRPGRGRFPRSRPAPRRPRSDPRAPCPAECRAGGRRPARAAGSRCR